MSKELDNKVVIVTGADSGIGRAAATLFGRAGAKLLLASSMTDAGHAVTDELNRAGIEARFVTTDIAEEASVQAMVATALDTYGRIDAAFNNAGIGYAAKRLHELDLAEWQKTIGVNLTGTFLCMKHEIAAMLKSGTGGSIVNTGSVGSVQAFSLAAEYNASKHGVLGLSRNAAIDYGSDGIRVNALLPGTIDTPLVPAMAAKKGADFKPSHENSVLGRNGTPEEAAAGALWLLSDAASFVTGAAFTVDGGFTLL